MNHERLKDITRESINVLLVMIDGYTKSIPDINPKNMIMERLEITEDEYNYIMDANLPPEVEYSESDIETLL